MPYPYQDSSLSIETRVVDLLSRMTLEEKLQQMSVRNGSAEGPGTAARVNNQTQKREIESNRHGIPMLLSRETSHGMANAGVTSFPASIAMACSFDDELIHRIGRAISKEAAAQNIRQGLSPVLDICRDPRWGRQEETFGEDPHVTGRLGVAFIKGLQNDGDLKSGILATPKHLVGYAASEGGKDNDPINITERDLHETYLPPFKAVFQQADAQSVMICFGALNGVPCTLDKRIVTDLLNEWKFNGFVIDDCPGIAGLIGHRAARDMKEAIGLAVNAGIDRQFWNYCGVLPTWEAGQGEFEKHLGELVREGVVPESRIDQAVSRVLRAKFRLGLFEAPYCDPAEAERVATDPAHKALAREAAVKGAVLLKNDGGVLPLDAGKIKKIAVIGPNAAEGQLGDYSGTPTHVVSPLEGIRAAVGAKVEVMYAKGCEILSAALVIQRFSVRLSGNLKVEVDDTYRLVLESNDGVRLMLGGKKIIDDWTPGPRRRREVTLPLTKGGHPITIEYFRGTKLLVTDENDPTAYHNALRLSWSHGQSALAVIPDDSYTLATKRSIQAEGSGEGLTMEVFFGANFDQPQPEQTRVVKDVDFSWGEASPILATAAENAEQHSIDEAVAIAKNADVAVVFVGETSSRKGAQQVCGEHFDRADISLTGSQEKLVLAVCATGTPTVVVLVNGRSLAMPKIVREAGAILEAWYPGQEGGHAIADLLFGKEVPSGKLAASIPYSAGQLPVYFARRPRMGWYIDEKSEPLYVFGFGLSYTTFEYTDLKISRREVSATVRNTGARDAVETVQLYLEPATCSFSTPLKRLVGYQRVSLKAGQSTTVKFLLSAEDFTQHDQDFKPRPVDSPWKIQLGPNSATGLTGTLML
ncbi:MAG TPA: glycoside hydrolase family 3 C-terminal domain-containing protein [Tepidisphaeraceae bacterium]|jgi:beta-glucosidase|nr:glycoside hydrolase family 3 C-terminal domain-containing protein [Tepidisphaeraceae bacterium]